MKKNKINDGVFECVCFLSLCLLIQQLLTGGRGLSVPAEGPPPAVPQPLWFGLTSGGNHLRPLAAQGGPRFIFMSIFQALCHCFHAFCSYDTRHSSSFAPSGSVCRAFTRPRVIPLSFASALFIAGCSASACRSPAPCFFLCLFTPCSAAASPHAACARGRHRPCRATASSTFTSPWGPHTAMARSLPPVPMQMHPCSSVRSLTQRTENVLGYKWHQGDKRLLAELVPFTARLWESGVPCFC